MVRKIDPFLISVPSDKVYSIIKRYWHTLKENYLGKPELQKALLELFRDIPRAAHHVKLKEKTKKMFSVQNTGCFSCLNCIYHPNIIKEKTVCHQHKGYQIHIND